MAKFMFGKLGIRKGKLLPVFLVFGKMQRTGTERVKQLLGVAG